MMMLEKSVAILEQVPDDQDIHGENDDNDHGMPGMTLAAMEQFVHFDRNEEHRFTDRQPSSPAHAKHQPHGFNQRKQAVNQRAGSGPENFGLGEFANPHSKVGPKFSFGIESQMLKQIPVVRGQVIVGKGPHDDSDCDEEQAFGQLDPDDGIERRSPPFDLFGFGAHRLTLNLELRSRWL